MADGRGFFDAIASRVDERLYGVREPLRLVLVGILADAARPDRRRPRASARPRWCAPSPALLGLRFQRVQFTPDLMPSDITGASVLDLTTNEFRFREGPVFTQILLADEINRATPKTQAALLEAMQERQVTADGVTHPAARAVLRPGHPEPGRAGGDLPAPRGPARPVPAAVRHRLPDRGAGGAASSIAAPARRGRRPVEPLPEAGGSRAPRGGRDRSASRSPSAATWWPWPAPPAIIPTSRSAPAPARWSTWATRLRAAALIDGRAFCLPDDVKALAHPVLAHRLVPDHRRADPRPHCAADILEEVLEEVPGAGRVPRA